MSLTVFAFSSQEVQKEIRTVVIGNEIWFVAKDVCEVMGLGNVSQALSRLDEDEKTLLPYSQVITINDNLDTTRLLAVSESGLYALVITSRKPQAKYFRKWITSEVIPSIRKTGKYAIESQENLPKNFKEALVMLIAKEDERERLEAEKHLLEEQNHQLAEAVDELFDYSSIIRIAKFNNVPETNFKWQTLKAMSVKMGIEVKRVPCPRFEFKNLYSHDVWRYTYPNIKLPETTTLVIHS